MKPTPDTLFRAIKPAIAMQVTVAQYSGNQLELTAPLEPNLNDKGTAFAGSISSMLVLAGWGLVTLRLSETGIESDVVVSKSETDYKRPVTADLCSIAKVAAEPLDQMIAELADAARARIQIQITLHSAGQLCATMVAQYVVLKHA